jgi:hypothetical protein
MAQGLIIKPKCNFEILIRHIYRLVNAKIISLSVKGHVRILPVHKDLAHPEQISDHHTVDESRH